MKICHYCNPNKQNPGSCPNATVDYNPSKNEKSCADSFTGVELVLRVGVAERPDEGRKIPLPFSAGCEIVLEKNCGPKEGIGA